MIEEQVAQLSLPWLEISDQGNSDRGACLQYAVYSSWQPLEVVEWD